MVFIRLFFIVYFLDKYVLLVFIIVFVKGFFFKIDFDVRFGDFLFRVELKWIFLFKLNFFKNDFKYGSFFIILLSVK